MPISRTDLNKTSKIYLIGENHNQSNNQRVLEMEFTKKELKCPFYYQEYNFPTAKKNQWGDIIMGDSIELRLRHKILSLLTKTSLLENLAPNSLDNERLAPYIENIFEENMNLLTELKWASSKENTHKLLELDGFEEAIIINTNATTNPSFYQDLLNKHTEAILASLDAIDESNYTHGNPFNQLTKEWHTLDQTLAGYTYTLDTLVEEKNKTDHKRDIHIAKTANQASLGEHDAVWKIGNAHAEGIKNLIKEQKIEAKFEVITQEDFTKMLANYQAKKTMQPVSKAKDDFIAKIKELKNNSLTNKTLNTKRRANLKGLL